MRYAGLLLLLAAACSQDLPAPAPARRAVHAQPAREQFGLVNPGDPQGTAVVRRNVFAYPESVRAMKAPSAVTVASNEASAKEDAMRRKAEEERMRLAEEKRKADEERRRKDFTFPYRYIGRFGPENGQLAAFVADGQATVVKAGEVLGGKFLVKAIGIESVEVSLLSAPELKKTLDIGQ